MLQIISFGKWALLSVQGVGLLLSLMLFAATFANRDQMETVLQSFAIEKVEALANEAWAKAEGAVGGDRKAQLRSLAHRFGLEAEQIDAQREDIVRALLAKGMSQDCDSACHLWVAGFANSTLFERAARLKIGQETLQDFIVARYKTTVRGLILDVRRFGAVTAVALALAMGLVLIKNYLNWRFVAFSVAVTGYTAWAAYGYAFEQNWAMSILLQDWSAPAYQFSMIVASILFFDWLFLKATITQTVTNLFATVLSTCFPA